MGVGFDGVMDGGGVVGFVVEGNIDTVAILSLNMRGSNLVKQFFPFPMGKRRR